MWNDGELAILDAIGERLRTRGWASFVTVEWLLADWKQLAGEVQSYGLTVDDYTNDLTTRDGLAIVILECPSALRDRLQAAIEDADVRFREGTVEDCDGLLGEYFSIAQNCGWWWKRIPKAGPLAEALVAEKRR
jgi:hypothetical protein